ncbi:hypothetical protein, partial [Pseudomonas syringae]|uniref:hypothetical protein n=1 Tax=Pseudomonas syringae TaxID=317 RepID=UPI00195E972E
INVCGVFYWAQICIFPSDQDNSGTLKSFIGTALSQQTKGLAHTRLESGVSCLSGLLISCVS